ncbi:MAG: protein kinase [Myxococcota bacterium]
MSLPDAAAGEPAPPRSGLGDSVIGSEFGKYRLHRRLARGGMGEVYLARLVGELGFEKQLVIKTILPELAEKPRFIELFAAEAKTAVALSHGNIVPAYELGRAADTFYIAMGYVDGPSVAQLLDAAEASGDPPDVAVAVHVIRGVLAGLAYAHREEPGRPAVVHRDITPRNVLIDRSGQVRIVDFGISAPARRQVGVRAGSTGFVSPEQARGDAADPRADVFSVGCLLYELCTHSRAFPKEGVWTMPEMDAVPPALRAPLTRAMDIEPDARFKDAGAMKSELRDAFTELAGTFDDAALARYLRRIFPEGWSPQSKESESGDNPVLGAPSETYATRLTAVTGVDLDAPVVAAETAARLSSDAIPVSTAEDAEDSTPAGVAQERRGRAPTALLLLGAVSIGAIAFAMGRTDARTSAPQRAPAAVPAADRTATLADTRAREAPRVEPDRAPDPNDDAAPTQPPPVVHTLAVSPANAYVDVDGERLGGPPPYAITLPAAGSVVVRVSRRGFTPQSFTLDAQGERPDAIDLVAIPSKPKEPGSLQVLAPTVAWAEVLVDGKKVGNTPTRKLSVSAGRHRVEVRCVPDACSPARTLVRKSVTVEPGKTTRIDAGR